MKPHGIGRHPLLYPSPRHNPQATSKTSDLTVKMRIPQTYIQRTKAGLHFAQAFCIFIAGCLSLDVLTKDGGTGGQTGYFFGLVSTLLVSLREDR